MTNFVWTGKDSSGNPIVLEVRARTAIEAKSILLAQGATDLALVEDELTEAIRQPFNKSEHFLGQRISGAMTAEDRVRLRNKSSATYLRALIEGIGQTKEIVILAAGLLVLFLYFKEPAGAILAGTGLIFWLYFLIVGRLPSITFAQLHRAVEWHRWEDVLHLVERMEHFRRILRTRIPENGLQRFRAIALAAQGRLDDALANYPPEKNEDSYPDWLQHSLLAGVYSAARDYDRAIQCYEKAIAEKPLPEFYLDLAGLYAVRKRDIEKARAALVEAERDELPDVMKPHQLLFRGVVANLEGDFPGAQRDLEAALKRMEATRHLPFRARDISGVKAYLSQALAKQGSLAEAKRYYCAARPYLAAAKERELMTDCEKALRIESA